MKCKKLIAVLLMVIVLFTAFNISSYAYSNLITNFDISSWNRVNYHGGVNSVTYVSGSGTTLFSLQASTTLERETYFYTIQNLRAEHEYQFNFDYVSNSNDYSLNVNLYVLDVSGNLVYSTVHSLSGNVYNTTSLTPISNYYKTYSFSFIPSKVYDLSTGYNLAIGFEFTNRFTSSSSGSYFIKGLQLYDLDENDNSSQSGFFSNVGAWFSKVYHSIVGGIDSSGTAHTGLVQGIVNGLSSALTTVKNGIVNGLDTLRDWILYFQSPVTKNSDGVPVDNTGQPVYVNPFENSLSAFRETLYGWVDSLEEFILTINSSADSVSGYISTGSTIINSVLTGVPLLAVILGFAVVFIVVRKVIGR